MPTLTWDGRAFLLAWSAGAPLGGASRLQRLDGALTEVSEPLGFGEAAAVIHPRVASHGDGRGVIMVTSSRPARASTVAFAEDAIEAGDACRESWTWASGFCVDGRCCDQPCSDSQNICQVCSTERA